MTASDQRLVTFVVTAYQQERFVREALEGAFAQTYRPLEILALDDASKDQTPQIIEDMVKSYAGPHAVRFIHNEKNVGNRAQANRAFREARGQLMVMGAGDDISHPTRAERAAARWREGDVYVYTSNSRVIDADGKDLGVLLGDYVPPATWQDLIAGPGTIPGSAICWDRSVFEKFGELPMSAVEDAVVCMRALLLGRMVYEPDCLVSYRRHGNNSTAWAKDRSRSKWDDYLWWTNGHSRDYGALYKAWEHDIELMLRDHPEAVAGAQASLRALRNNIDICEVRARLTRGEQRRLRDLLTLWRIRDDVPSRTLGTTAMWLLSPTVYRHARSILDRVR
jgi:glycosyltransferase involved in cell wall biosynthesis